MPVYEYVCESCQEVFAEKRPISASDATAVCPGCESEKTRRRMTAIAFVGKTSSQNQASIPLPMSGGGCCGGVCGCHSDN